MIRKQFNNHTVFVKASFGYVIVIVKHGSILNKGTVEKILESLRPYYDEGFYSFFVVISPAVKIKLKTVENLTLGFDHSKIQKIAFVDYGLYFFDRLLINSLIKLFYLKGSVMLKIFRNKKQAVKWLKI